ncbi:MAG: hypothetical protein GF365_00870 [Candidatus Buchananbacteria bacterium]|nr:hypothetical protein [Candidatus Buchananbacteria bacterium]
MNKINQLDLQDIIKNSKIPIKKELIKLKDSYSYFIMGYWIDKFDIDDQTFSIFSEIIIIKDYVNASCMLAHLNYFEQANGLLRVAFEKELRIICQIINPQFGFDGNGKFKVEQSIDQLAKEFKNNVMINFIKDRYYNKFYKKLCQPIHNPISSITDSFIDELPQYSRYDYDKYLGNFKYYIEISVELILITAIYCNIDIQDITPHKKIFADDIDAIIKINNLF